MHYDTQYDERATESSSGIENYGLAEEDEHKEQDAGKQSFFSKHQKTLFVVLRAFWPHLKNQLNPSLAFAFKKMPLKG